VQQPDRPGNGPLRNASIREADRRDCPSGQTCVLSAGAQDVPICSATEWDAMPSLDYGPPYFLVHADRGLPWTCTHVNGIAGDPAAPPATCHPGCMTCGWDPTTEPCIFTRGVQLGIDAVPRIYQMGDPVPLVFGLGVDDGRCNMFGSFFHNGP
jgi:hypothetical protein